MCSLPRSANLPGSESQCCHPASSGTVVMFVMVVRKIASASGAVEGHRLYKWPLAFTVMASVVRVFGVLGLPARRARPIESMASSPDCWFCCGRCC